MFARLSVMFGVVSFCHYRVVFLCVMFRLAFLCIMFRLIFLYVIAGLAFLSVMFGLDPDIHRFPGQASSPSVIADLIFLTVIPRLNRGIQEIPGSRYACPRMTEEKIILSLPDLIRHSSVEQGIHRHKAWPHDMHAESNALQRKFVSQPVLRSSWQQLVIFARGLLKK